MTAGTAAACARATLIIRGLSGRHLHGFLPGQDNQAAISAAVASCAQWCAGYWGQVTRKGIGEWVSGTAWLERKPASAVVWVTWAEALAIVARGCANGHREAYEAAYGAWCTAARAAGGQPGAAVTRALHDAEDALIRHGCLPAPEPVPGSQLALWEVAVA